MRRVFLILFLMATPLLVIAQDAPKQAADSPVAPAPKIEEKPKPVILDEVKRLRLTVANQSLELAKRNLKDAENAIADFWRSLGIDPAELQTKWSANNGQNGDIILTRNTENAPKPAPEAKKN